MMNVIKRFGMVSGLSLMLVLTSFAATSVTTKLAGEDPVELQDRQRDKPSERPVERPKKEEKNDKPRDEGKRDDKSGKKKPDNWTASLI